MFRICDFLDRVMESTGFPLFLLVAEIVFNRPLFLNVSRSDKSARGTYRAGCVARLPHPGRDRGGRRPVPSLCLEPDPLRRRREHRARGSQLDRGSALTSPMFEEGQPFTSRGVRESGASAGRPQPRSHRIRQRLRCAVVRRRKILTEIWTGLDAAFCLSRGHVLEERKVAP